MSDSSQLLTSAQQDRIRCLVSEVTCDNKWSILPTVAETSGRYEVVDDKIGLLAACLGIGLAGLLITSAPIIGRLNLGQSQRFMGFLPVVAVLVGGFGAGLLAVRFLPSFRRLLIPRSRLQESVQQAASNALAGIEDELVLLMYVSVYEREVLLLPTPALEPSIDSEQLQQIRATMLHYLNAGKLETALEEGISAAGELLQTQCPEKRLVDVDSPGRLVLID